VRFCDQPLDFFAVPAQDGYVQVSLMRFDGVFERNLIRERTTAGLTAARARGKKGGRPKALTGRQLSIARSLYNDKQHSIAEICQTLKISRATLYRTLKSEEKL
jgi:DNA invertase Pin-like site-specific DNA recombinase